ncbi:ABC transporter ATP-binding protein [Nostoc sp. C052]|uniref:ABC transporter ATP-binding protein n=1 Tax=Nostoc sp. C052 TaxID=2576902 RepID=UPI00277B5127|nr:ABC transporter ATP-binding protein [Nostoc sp. C052]
MVKELAICTRGLTKQFDRHVAVNDVDLEIQAGEVYGLIGPNGAGKTTLIRMLATAEESTTGEIYINGDRLLRDKSNPKLKRRLGYLPDDYPLYEDLTVWDYLDYFARLYRLQEPRRTQRLHEVLELIQLGNKRNSQISTLSRGMKQRLSLARTIIHEPILLLLDEPVSGLDPIARMQFREIIKALQEAGMTVIISSHVLSDLAELCTSVGIMELGYQLHEFADDNFWRDSWENIFLTLSVIFIFTLLFTGTYLLISDLAKEETCGTLNFIRLSPQSETSILTGKLLGVPSLIYLTILVAVPLHLWACFTPLRSVPCGKAYANAMT